MGFALQSFPLERSALSLSDTTRLLLPHHSSRSAQVQPERTIRSIMPEGITKQIDAITTGSDAQVRSHPAPVLPETGGRYSLELSYPSFTSHCLSLQYSRAHGFTPRPRPFDNHHNPSGTSSKPEHPAKQRSGPVHIDFRHVPAGIKIYTHNSTPFQSFKNTKSYSNLTTRTQLL